MQISKNSFQNEGPHSISCEVYVFQVLYFSLRPQCGQNFAVRCSPMFRLHFEQV